MSFFDGDDVSMKQRRSAFAESKQHGEPIVATETFWPARDTDDEDAGEQSGNPAYAHDAPLKRKMTAGTKAKYQSGFKAALRKFARSFNKGYQLLPNDQRERERNVTQHRLFTEMYGGKLHLAPLDSPGRVLDLGCGPAAWTLDFAREHPDCEVIGIDLEPTRTTEKLPNCRFEVGDFSAPWNLGDKFDFIYLRMLGGLPSLQLLNRIHENLKPGGWAEFAEWIQIASNSNRSDEGTALETWARCYRLAFKRMNLSAYYPMEYEGMLKQVGFSEIYLQGQLATDSCSALMDALAGPLFTGVLGWPAEKTEELLTQAKIEVASPKMHSFMTLVTVYARKTPKDPGEAGELEAAKGCSKNGHCV